MEEDKICWSMTTSGSFTLKSAYEMLANEGWNQPDPKWNGAWNFKGPQQIKFFLWLALRGAILTNEQRYHRHMSTSPQCSMCGNQAESIIHVLRDCGKARSVWLQLLPGEYIPTFFAMNDDEWLKNNLADLGTRLNGLLWSTLFGVTCWFLWKWRNQYIFSGTTVLRKKEILLAFTNEVQRLNDSSPRLNSTSKQCRMVGWLLPEEGFIKLNRDGSFKSTISRPAARSVLRDSHGNWVGVVVMNYGSSNVENAEL